MRGANEARFDLGEVLSIGSAKPYQIRLGQLARTQHRMAPPENRPERPPRTCDAAQVHGRRFRTHKPREVSDREDILEGQLGAHYEENGSSARWGRSPKPMGRKGSGRARGGAAGHFRETSSNLRHRLLGGDLLEASSPPDQAAGQPVGAGRSLRAVPSADAESSPGEGVARQGVGPEEPSPFRLDDEPASSGAIGTRGRLKAHERPPLTPAERLPGRTPGFAPPASGSRAPWGGALASMRRAHIPGACNRGRSSMLSNQLWSKSRLCRDIAQPHSGTTCPQVHRDG